MPSEPVLVTGPTTYPITVGEVRDQLRVDAAEEDGWFRDKIIEAVEAAEDFCWSRFITQTWKQYEDGLADLMYLRHGPVQSITSVKYTDTAGVLQTASSALYELGNEDGCPLIRLAYSQSWPATRGHYDDIELTCVCGYGAASAVPAQIKSALRLYVAHGYLHRDDGALVPEAFYRLLGSYSFRRSLPVEA
jgi:uncharacterized phiE125 gp8 family phage protein